MNTRVVTRGSIITGTIRNISLGNRESIGTLAGAWFLLLLSASLLLGLMLGAALALLVQPLVLRFELLLAGVRFGAATTDTMVFSVNICA